MASSRTGNCLRKVSCRSETQWRQAGQETACEKFPVGVKRNGVKPDRKLLAKKFPVGVKRNSAKPDKKLLAKSFLSE